MLDSILIQWTPLNVDTSGGCDFVHINRLSRLSGVAYSSGQKFKTTHVWIENSTAARLLLAVQ